MLAILVGDREGEVVVERVVGGLRPSLEGQPEQLRASPAEPPDRLVAPGLRHLIEAAVDGRIVLDQPVAPDDRVDVIALAPCRQPDELDRAAGERTGDVAAKLDHRPAIMLEQIVVVWRAVDRRDAIVLEQVELARLPPRVEAISVVRPSLERPARRQVGVLVEIAVELLAALDRLAGQDVGDEVRTFLELAVAAGPAGEVDRRGAAPNRRRAGDVGVHIAGEPAFGRRGQVGVEAAVRRHHDVQHLALAGIVGAVEVARAELDPKHLLGRDACASVTSSVSALELGRAPLITTLPAVPAKPRTSTWPWLVWVAPRSSVNPGTRLTMSSAVRGAYWAKNAAW